MRDRLQAVEKELALAKVELAKKDKIYGTVINDLNHRKIKEDNPGTSEPTINLHTKSTPSTTGKPQDIPGTKSAGDQQRPANSTLPAVLGLHTQCKVCDKEIPSKNFLQHCQADHNIDVLGLPMQCNICEREISSKNFFQHCQNKHNIGSPTL